MHTAKRNTVETQTTVKTQIRMPVKIDFAKGQTSTDCRSAFDQFTFKAHRSIWFESCSRFLNASHVSRTPRIDPRSTSTRAVYISSFDTAATDHNRSTFSRKSISGRKVTHLSRGLVHPWNELMKEKTRERGKWSATGKCGFPFTCVEGMWLIRA